MALWQMLPGQMSLWQFASVKDYPRNLALKFGQNKRGKSWDIADVEFPVVVGRCGGKTQL